MSLALQVLHAVMQTAPPPDGTILEKANTLTTEAKTTLRNVGGAMAVASFMFAAWKARGALAGVLVGAIGAILFIWLLNNIDSGKVQDPVDRQIGSGPPPVVRVDDATVGSHGPAQLAT